MNKDALRKKYSPKKTSTKKGQKLVCVSCGREVVITDWGASDEVIYCCGKPMQKK